jgi:hypothetical protein
MLASKKRKAIIMVQRQKKQGSKPRVYTVKVSKEDYERMLEVRLKEGKTMTFQVADALKQYWRK